MAAIVPINRPFIPERIKRQIARHPLLAYTALAFASAWLIWLPLVLGQNGIGLLPYSFAFPDAFNPLVGFVGLTLPAFGVAALAEGQAGVADLRQRIVLWRVGARWYVLTLLGIPALVLLGGTAWRGLPPADVIQRDWIDFAVLFLPETLLIGLLVNVWEEIGWTGFVLPRAQQRYGPGLASVVVGILFAGIHLPLFLIGGVPALRDLAMFVPLMIVIAVEFRLIVTWLCNKTRGAVVIAVLFHAAFNAANGHLPRLFPGIDDRGQYMFLAIAGGLAATALLVLTRGRVVINPRDTARPASDMNSL